jgi:hypothetical protein
MERILVQSESKEDMKLFTALAVKMGMKTTVIEEDEEMEEDIALGHAINQGLKGDYVDTIAFLEKLKRDAR